MRSHDVRLHRRPDRAQQVQQRRLLRQQRRQVREGPRRCQWQARVDQRWAIPAHAAHALLEQFGMIRFAPVKLLMDVKLNTTLD